MDITLEDFIQKYRNTFVFLKTNQGNLLTEFTDSGDQLFFTEPDLGLIQVTFDNAKKTIVTKFPETGIYNFGDYLFGFLYRVPERQYKCCPSKSNTAIKEVYTNENLSIDFKNIKEAFHPSYPQNKWEAVELAAKRGGVALNNRFGITISDLYDWDLYYHMNKIGYIQHGIVHVTYTPLRQEAIDFFGEDLIWKK